MNEPWLDRRLLACAVAAALLLLGFGEAVSALPQRKAPVVDRKIEITLVTPPAPPPVEPPPPALPPPPPPPEPLKPLPPKVTANPTNHPVATHANQVVTHDVIPSNIAPSEHAVVATEGTEAPVFGVSMESTSQAGTGAVVAVGNAPVAGAAGAATGAAKPGAPVAAVEVTKMPLPQGRCSGKYTDDARAAAIEGTVILDLVVDERGHARDISVVQGLDHGLTDAAITALKQCQFSPGERAGLAVPVRIRGFKIRFLLQDAN